MSDFPFVCFDSPKNDSNITVGGKRWLGMEKRTNRSTDRPILRHNAKAKKVFLSKRRVVDSSLVIIPLKSFLYNGIEQEGRQKPFLLSLFSFRQVWTDSWLGKLSNNNSQCFYKRRTNKVCEIFINSIKKWTFFKF